MDEIKNPQLQAIARALDIEPEALLVDGSEADVGEVTRLLHLWSKIDDVQGRRRVLSILRQEAERCGYQE
jgi:hypothetical protein